MPVDCVTYIGSYAVAAPRADRKSLVHAVASAEHGLTERDPVDATAADPNKASEAVAQCYAFLCSNAMSFYFASIDRTDAVPEHERAYALSAGPPHRLASTGPVGSTDLCADRNAIDSLAVIRSHWAAGLRADELFAVELPEHRGSLVGADDSVARRLAHEGTLYDQPDESTEYVQPDEGALGDHADAVLVAQLDALVRADELPVVRPDVMPVAVPEPAAQPAADLLAQRRTVASTKWRTVELSFFGAVAEPVELAVACSILSAESIALFCAVDASVSGTVAHSERLAFGRTERVAVGGPDIAAQFRAVAGAHGLAVLRAVVDSIFLPDVQPVAHAVSLSVGVPIFRAVGRSRGRRRRRR